MPTKLLYAMRHCETLFNVQHKSQGWCDSPITPRGIEQCKRSGEELARRGITFDHFYSSTSERCCDTMELVCEAAFGHKMHYEHNKGLRECGFGIFEGKDDFCEPFFTPLRSMVMEAAGGESDEQVNERMNATLSAIMSDSEAQNVLVTSSGGSLMHFYFMHERTSRTKPLQNGNCMVYVYEWEDGVFSCVEVYQPDFSDIDCGGMDGSGVPEKWTLSIEDVCDR